MSAYPKIELHVHLEGTVRAETLKEIAARNDYALPDDVDYRGAFRDFAHFIAAFEVRMNALRTYDDFRRVVVEYAGEAAAQGAVYIEAISRRDCGAGSTRTRSSAATATVPTRRVSAIASRCG